MFRTTILSIFILILISGCEQKSNYLKLNGSTMGTTYSITFKAPTSQFNKAKLHQKVEQELKLINQLMSTYIEDSELSLFNAALSTQCQPLSNQTLYVIESAIKVAQQTQGKFDVTLAPLIEIWGFDKKQTHNQVPAENVIQQLLGEIGFQKLSVGEGCVAKQNPSLSVNLSAIAKGYGVDRIAEIIEAEAIANYLVEIGGEVATKGKNPKGIDWRIAIESASSAKRSIQQVVSTKGLGVATSGDYRNYFEKDGKRYSHTLDPTSGYPITHNLASVTVLHPKTMLADAYATAMMVMGPQQALKFANEQQLAVFMLIKENGGFKEIYNEAFAQHLSQVN
ncbi:FAD:protein FMN transferase [Aliikangiella sp. IMCC44653]